MRASGVRIAIIAVVEGATVDAQASARDTFVHVDTGGRELEQAPDRVFRCALSQAPSRGDLITGDMYEVEYTCHFYYTPTKDAEDRIALDMEQVTYDLIALNSQDADIYKSDAQSGAVFEAEGLIVVSVPIQVSYRLTGVN